MSLQDIVDKIERVKTEQEKLEAGNKFLQSYVAPPGAYLLRENKLLFAYIADHYYQIYRRAHANLQDHRCALKNKGQGPKWEVMMLGVINRLFRNYLIPGGSAFCGITREGFALAFQRNDTLFWRGTAHQGRNEDLSI
jgi:hypothetical protein